MASTTETSVGESLYANAWQYKGSTFSSDDIGDFFGFVYLITNLESGKQYIGRKYFTQCRKHRGSRRKRTSESNWKKYYGSSKELNEDRKLLGDHTFKREILSLQPTAGKVNFEETRQLFLHNVLTETLKDGTPAYYNSNILGRYYKKDYFDV
tara:strand:+ start:471 stop:929 length:459 start_codon:yes stop_codon:yes gene_type:complete